jgi:hypothetical protein
LLYDAFSAFLHYLSSGIYRSSPSKIPLPSLRASKSRWFGLLVPVFTPRLIVMYAIPYTAIYAFLQCLVVNVIQKIPVYEYQFGEGLKEHGEFTITRCNLIP